MSARADARASGPILSADSVAGLFAPSVPAGATAPISEFSGMPDCQFGNGLCLATADWPGRRRKGSGSCASFLLFSFHSLALPPLLRCSALLLSALVAL